MPARVQIRPMIDAGLVLNERFEVIKHLGAGGMGEVYLGKDLQTGQNVAIKRMLIEQDEMDKELFDRRFKEEISILRRLDCPGIPAFVHAFSEDGHSFLVMEFIQGYSLDTLLRVCKLQNEALSSDQVATVALHVSRVLEYLHSQVPPLVHRDIKPSNLIIRESDQRIFLVDFGLAREVHSKSSAKTQVGTWSYAPIEQIRGFVEPRSDFYSLGVTMLELLSGEVPTALAVPPARKLLPHLPEPLAQVIDRCTKAEVTLRYPEACLLRQDLEEAITVMNDPLAKSEAAPMNPQQSISEMVRKWGQGRAAEPMARPVLGSGPVVPGASPEVKKAVDRARRRLFYSRPEIVMLRSILVLIFLAVCLRLGWTGYQARRQEDLARPITAQGELGPGWTLLGARGLVPSATGAGLESSSGLVFSRGESQNIQELSFQFKSLRGKADLLVFAGSYGIRIVPNGNRYQGELVQVTPLRSLKMPANRPLGPKLNLPAAFSLSLTTRKNQLVLSRDGREAAHHTVSPALEWRSEVCGVMQSAERAQVSVSQLVCRPIFLR